jgi:hypothetical protein
VRPGEKTACRIGYKMMRNHRCNFEYHPVTFQMGGKGFDWTMCVSHGSADLGIDTVAAAVAFVAEYFEPVDVALLLAGKAVRTIPWVTFVYPARIRMDRMISFQAGPSRHSSLDLEQLGAEQA